MAIDVISVQFNGGFLPNLRLLNLRYNTSTKLSLPCAMAFPRIGHGPAMSQGRILEKSKGWSRVLGRSISGQREAERCISKTHYCCMYT